MSALLQDLADALLCAEVEQTLAFLYAVVVAARAGLVRNPHCLAAARACLPTSPLSSALL